MHQRIGILGGMSPESTTVYYEHITRRYTERFGDYGYPEILIYSVNSQKFVGWQHAGTPDCLRPPALRWALVFLGLRRHWLGGRPRLVPDLL